MNALLFQDFTRPHDGAADPFRAGEVRSLWEMLKPYAEHFASIGAEFQRLRIILFNVEGDEIERGRSLHKDEEDGAIALFSVISRHCKQLNMPVSENVLSDIGTNLPRTMRELEIIWNVLNGELKTKMFMYIPSHLVKYHEIVFPSNMTMAFPTAVKEIASSGDCLSASLFTASVFHCMRAAEIGMRALGKALDVSFPDKPLELAEWQNILDQADSKIVKMKELRRSSEKDEQLEFYSQAAVQFRYFKDAWRIRVAHARESYEERKSIQIFNHTIEFFEVLSRRLKET